MTIECFFSACLALGPGGVGVYGVVEKVNGTIVWTDAGCSGRKGERVATARYAAAIISLRRLIEERAEHPTAAMRLTGEDRRMVQELRGDLVVSSSESYYQRYREAAQLFDRLAEDLRFEYKRRDAAVEELILQTLRRQRLDAMVEWRWR